MQVTSSICSVNLLAILKHISWSKFRFGIDMIIQARRLNAHVFGEIAHRCGVEAVLPEKLRSLFEYYLFTGTVLFAFCRCHAWLMIKYKISFRFAHQIPDLSPENTNMSLIVVGTMAFDAIETPFGKTDKIIGGSATYLAYTASKFH